MVTRIMMCDYFNSQVPLRRTGSCNIKTKVMEQLLLEQDLLCQLCYEM